MPDIRTAKKLNLEKIGQYLEEKGYKVKKLEQLWRHVTGRVMFNNEMLFFKMGSTPEISTRTKNEAVFNRNANKYWNKQIRSFSVPKMFDDGEYEGLYWFVREYVFGKPVADYRAKRKSLSLADADLAVTIAKEIDSVSETLLLPKDREHIVPVWQKRFVEVATKFAKETNNDTKKLVKFIEANKNHLQIGSSHGDFTPWVIYKTQEKKAYLIDAEAAQLTGIRHYDAVYFFHRTYTQLKDTQAAKYFWEQYCRRCGLEENDRLLTLILAQQIIGGYFDAERDGTTDDNLNRELEKMIS